MAKDKLPKFKVLVDMELRAESIDEVDDLIAGTWELGDPNDDSDATIWVKSIEPIAEVEA